MRPVFLSLPVLAACACLLAPFSPRPAHAGEDLRLVWSANDEPTLRGYRIYEADGAGRLGLCLGELLVEEIPWELRITDEAAFDLHDVPPGHHCWAVTAFDREGNESGPSNPACIAIDLPAEGSPVIHMPDLHENAYYGCYPGAERDYGEGVVYTFEGGPGERLLTCRFWDVDSPDEVEILVNGMSLGYAEISGGRGLSPTLAIRIPPEYLEAHGLNTLRFEPNASVSDGDWAVGTVEIVGAIPLPVSGFYGNLANVPGGDTSHPRAVGFTFGGRPGRASLAYEAYDVDFAGEIQVYVNGRKLGKSTRPGNNAFRKQKTLVIPDSWVLDRGVNTILFKNVLNPPYALIWGVGNVRVP